MLKLSWTYIMTNQTHSVLYTGVTTDIAARVEQHRAGEGSAFTRKYRCYKLVYLEEHEHVSVSVKREKQIKAGSREDKIALIKGMNPEWKDLAEAWRSDSEIAASDRRHLDSPANDGSDRRPDSQ